MMYLSKDEHFAQDVLSSFDVAQEDPELVEESKEERRLVVRPACPERSVFDGLRPSVEGLTTSGNAISFASHRPHAVAIARAGARCRERRRYLRRRVPR
jgi:hypothetical protein